MGIDYVSKIILSIPVEVKTEIVEEKITKYDENTGQPYLKTNKRSKTTYLVGEHLFTESNEFHKFCEENDLEYRDSSEILYKTIFSLDENCFDFVDFSISDLQDAKLDLLRLFVEKGIKVDENEIDFELVHFLC